MIYQLAPEAQWGPLLLSVSGSHLQFQRQSEHQRAADNNKGRIDTLSISLADGHCQLSKAPPFPRQQQQQQGQRQQQQGGQQQQQQQQPPLVAGCLGLLNLQHGAVVAIAAEAKQVAVSAGSVVYRVKGCQLMAAAHVETDPTDCRMSRLLREALDATSSNMYFSYSLDITRPCQAQAAAAAAAAGSGGASIARSSKQVWQALRREYVWNDHLAQPLLAAGCHSFVLPIISGHVAQLQRIPLVKLTAPPSGGAAAAAGAQGPAAPPDTVVGSRKGHAAAAAATAAAGGAACQGHDVDADNDDDAPAAPPAAAAAADQVVDSTTPAAGEDPAASGLVLGCITVLSRKSHRRPSSGIWCRGLDPAGSGAAAGLVETEVVISLDRDQFIAAHTHLSGSAPVVWAQLPQLLPPWLLPVLQPLAGLAGTVFPGFRNVGGYAEQVLVIGGTRGSRDGRGGGGGGGGGVDDSSNDVRSVQAAGAARAHLLQLQKEWGGDGRAAAATAAAAAGSQVVVVDLLSCSSTLEQQLQEAVAETLDDLGAVRMGQGTAAAAPAADASGVAGQDTSPAPASAAAAAGAAGGAGDGPLLYFAHDLHAAGSQKVGHQLQLLLQELQQVVLQHQGVFSCSRAAYRPAVQQQVGPSAANSSSGHMHQQQPQQQPQQRQQESTVVLSWQHGVVRSHSWASADRVALLAWQIGTAVVERVLEEQQLLAPGALLQDELPQLAGNFDLLWAGRADALALQLAGSEALGSQLIRRGRGSSRSWAGAVDDAVMGLSRWWANCFTEATRQDAQLVLHGCGDIAAGAGGSSSGGTDIGPSSGGKHTTTRDSSVWQQQPQSSAVLILALVQLLLALGHGLKLLYQLGSSLALAARDPTAAVAAVTAAARDCSSTAEAAAACVEVLLSACSSVLVQLLLPLGLALLLLAYVAGWHDCYVCWPQLMQPGNRLGRQPPWHK